MLGEHLKAESQPTVRTVITNLTVLSASPLVSGGDKTTYVLLAHSTLQRLATFGTKVGKGLVGCRRTLT